MSKQFVPRFKEGERLGAGKLNQLSDAAARHGTINPDDGDSFNNSLGNFRAGEQGPAGASLFPFMLLTDMRQDPQLYPSEVFPRDKPGDSISAYNPTDNNPPRRRHYSAKAVKLQYTDQPTYVLRFSDDAPTTMTWYLMSGGGGPTQTMYNQSSGALQAPSAAQLQVNMEALTFWNDKVEVKGWKDYWGGTDKIRMARKVYYIRFSLDVPTAIFTGLTASTNDENGNPVYNNYTASTETGWVSPFFRVVASTQKIQWFRDDWWPTDTVQTVWNGLPSQDQLKSGAMVWAQKVAGRGWVVLHGECWTTTPSS